MADRFWMYVAGLTPRGGAKGDLILRTREQIDQRIDPATQERTHEEQEEFYELLKAWRRDEP